MRSLIGLLIVLLISPAVHAADLTKIERTIAKEPAYAGKPKYCLLVFGPEAKTRIWLALDGDKLYVDRNGNGDLTDDGPALEATIDGAGEGVTRSFTLPELREGGRLRKQLNISVSALKAFSGGVPAAKEILKVDPGARGYHVSIDVEIPGRKGNGIDGRISHLATLCDPTGFLSFATSPRAAPIIHFGGLWSILFYSMDDLLVGRDSDLVLSIGTPGIGPGTTAFIAYDKVVPERLRPTVEISFPPKTPGGPPVKEQFELKQRCCTVNFHDTVRIPESIGVGRAKARVSFDAWLDGLISPTEYELKVVAPPPGPKLEAVSARLKRSRQHTTRNGSLVGVRYSADGKKIIAGDYPGGVAELWEVETGKQLTRIETGRQRNYEYIQLSPDWSTFFAAQEKSDYSRLERDGKRLIKWEMHGVIRSWNLDTGQIRDDYRYDPPRSVGQIWLSPDGRRVATFEELSGESEGSPTRASSLWDVKTKRHWPLPDGLHMGIDGFSPDGQLLFGVRTEKDGGASSAALIDASTASAVRVIPIAEKFSMLMPFGFSPDGRLVLAIQTTRGSKDTPQSDWQSSLRLWEAGTGQEALSYSPPEPKAQFGYCKFSPDGRWLAALVRGPRGTILRDKVLVFDIPKRQLARTLEFGMLKAFREPAFSADGRWLAIIGQAFPDDPRDPTPDEVPQARIHLINMSSGEIRETLICPPGFPVNCCFSPDGKTLATGGRGKVHLWDVSDLK